MPGKSGAVNPLAVDDYRKMAYIGNWTMRFYVDLFYLFGILLGQLENSITFISNLPY